MKPSRLIPLFGTIVMLGICVTLISNTPQTEAAFGTSPPWVRNNHMLPGTSFEQVIQLSRNDPNQDMKANVRINGDKELLKWIKIEDQNRLIMKKGDMMLPMKVVVEVPQKAALKDYRGSIFVTMAPVQEGNKEGGTVAIALGANISVEISVVGTKVTDYRMQSVSLGPIDEGKSFKILVELQNMGNTEITTLDGQIDIYEENSDQILKTLTLGTLDPPVSPDEVGHSFIDYPDVILKAGRYWIYPKVNKDGKTIYENRLFLEVRAPVIPVVTPEAALANKPSLPKLPTLSDETLMAEKGITPETLKPAASSGTTPEARMFVIFGLAGIGFGVIALIGILVVLVVLVKSQKKANIERYLAEQMRNNSASR